SAAGGDGGGADDVVVVVAALAGGEADEHARRQGDGGVQDLDPVDVDDQVTGRGVVDGDRVGPGAQRRHGRGRADVVRRARRGHRRGGDAHEVRRHVTGVLVRVQRHGHTGEPGEA